jgi:hypothetical protein
MTKDKVNRKIDLVSSFEHLSFLRASSLTNHICSITLSPNCEHLISVAPSISRAKS